MGKQIMVDLQGCQYCMDLWQRIEVGLGLPDWFGKNLDALWDVLDDVTFVPLGTSITFLAVDEAKGDAKLLFDEIRQKVFAPLQTEREDIILRFTA